MRYLVLSDIHANLHALRAVLADAATVGFDATVCLGDLVGYGANPREVVDAIGRLDPVVLIRGNHDKVCAGLEPATLFNEAARRSVEWTQAMLTAEQTAVLRDLPAGPARVSDGLEVCHGTPFDEDYYLFDESDAQRAMAAMSERVCFFGHTHVPTLFTEQAIDLDPLDGGSDVIQLPASGRVLMNLGSVGQPRDGDPRAAYGVYDAIRHTVEMRRVDYDVAAAQDAIRQAGLPVWLAVRLARGQ